MGDPTRYVPTLIRELERSGSKIEYAKKARISTLLHENMNQGYHLIITFANRDSLKKDALKLLYYSLSLLKESSKKDSIEEESIGKGFLLGILFGLIDTVQEKKEPLSRFLDKIVRVTTRALKRGQLPLTLDYVKEKFLESARGVGNADATKQINRWAFALAA